MNELQRWMTENAMSLRIQLIELEKQHGLAPTGDNRFVSFTRSRNVDSPVANFAAGKMFNVGNWDVVEPKGVTTTHDFGKVVKEALDKLPNNKK